MNSLETSVLKLNELIIQGKTLEAIALFYAPAVSIQENNEAPQTGKEACLERERQNLQRVKSISSNLIHQAIDLHNQVVFSEWEFQFTTKENKGRILREVSVQQWSEGLIQKEKFYYQGMISKDDES